MAHLYDEEMTELLSEAAPLLKERHAALFQLLEAAAVAGQIDLGLGMFVVTPDPSATETNILTTNTYIKSNLHAR